MIRHILNRITGHPTDEGDPDVDVSEIGEVFAVLISMVMTVVDVVFAVDLPDAKLCPKCPFMKGPLTKNQTISLYKCAAQRDFLESMWSSYTTTYWSFLSIVLAACSMVVDQIASPIAMRLIKHTFLAAIACLIWYISEFQYHFDSVSKISAYVKSVLLVYLWILPLVLIVAFFPNAPRMLVKGCIMCISAALIFHLGFSGYNMFCGYISRPLSAYLVLYFFYVSKLAMKQEVPSHVSLAMCLLVVPPMCPMSVLLLCWCFDVFWTDLSFLVMRVRDPPGQETGAEEGDNKYDRPTFRNGYRLRKFPR